MKNLLGGKRTDLAKKINLGRMPHLKKFYARYIGMLQAFNYKTA